MQSLFRLLATLTAISVTLAIAIAAVAGGAFYFLAPGLPSADTIRDVKLQTPLRIYTRDGLLLAQLGEQRRTPVRFDDVPALVVKAFLAAEDDRFFQHPGFDYQGITRAGLKMLTTGERSQGGSTITQQLARAYFLSPERTFVRKAKELILAVRIEHEFTKPEILALYLNKIFLGQRAYGVAAAAEVYFGKSLDQLSLAEAATIAGIPKAPSTLNPVANPVRAAERRSYVLRRMLDLGYITNREFTAANTTAMVSRLHGPKIELDASYITEMVRADMVTRLGPAAYTDGYRVITTVDSRLQSAANLALRTAIYEYDRRHGYRGPAGRNALAKLAGLPAGARRDQAMQDLLERFPGDQDLRPAIVLSVRDDNTASFYVRDLGVLTLPWDGLRWRRFVSDDEVGPSPKSAAELVAAGDVVHLLHTLNRGWLLAQVPQVEGAFVAMDPQDGATVALSGGFDFYASNYNRAVQAKRQPGSSFKPFIYSAALEHGFTTATLVNDAPIVFGDENMEDEWRPENNSRDFNGPTRLREALVKSLNLVSVRVLMGTGVNAAIDYIRQFGFDDTALPHNLSLALGSGGASPWDMASGYCVFANGGHRIDRYFIDRIEDASGKVIFQAHPRRVCRSCEAAMAVAAAQPAPDDTGAAALTARPEAHPKGAGAMSPITEPAAPVDIAPSMADAATPGNSNDAPRIITPENAYLVYDMMRDVIKRGTGRRARDLGRSDIAGKTGTSNERRDTWFSGYNGALVATAWIGFDQERSLGAREEGSQTALPMWKYFMARALHGQPETPLLQPPSLLTVRISPQSGRLAAAGDSSAIFELFRPSDLAPREDGTSGEQRPGVAVTTPEAGTDIF